MIEYLLEGNLIDLDENVEIELTYSINDIRNPVSTNSSWSKTIQIPGTANNNVIFQFLYENNIQSGYNPNVKKNVEIRINSLTIIRGYQKIVGLTMNNGTIYYEVNVIGNNIDIFSEIGDELLTDLDLSSYDHTYTNADIVATWEDTINDGYYYPFENHNDKPWSFEDIQLYTSGYSFYPAMYVSTIVNKIFTSKGYTIDSTFFQTDYFRSLYLPFTNESASDYVKLIELASDYQIAHPVGIPVETYVLLAETYDPLNICAYMNPITPAGGGYWELIVSGHTKTGAGYDFVDGEIVVTLYNTFLDQTDPNYATGLYIYQLPTGLSGDFSFTFTTPFVKEGFVVFPRSHVYRDPDPANWKSGIITYWTMNFKAAAFYQGFSEVKPSRTLPTGLKQKDFLTTLFNMFNLYVETNPEDDTEITIEPYSYYYGRSTDTIDWTYKVDESSRKYKLMSELESSSYKFSYKSDNDALNKTYQDNTKKVIGEYTTTISTDFISNEKKIELLCSPTCVEKLPDYTIVHWPSSYKTIEAADKESVNNGTITTGWNWRILSKNVLRTNVDIVLGTFSASLFYTGSHIINYDGSYILDSHSLLFNDVIDTGYTWNYGTFTGLTSLYTDYWKEYIDIIKNQNSRLLTIDVYLTEIDISKLRFYEKILINDSWYILNQLVYSPTSRKGQAELLLIPATN